MFDELQNTIKIVEKEGAEFVDSRYDELVLRTIIKDNGRIRQFKEMKRSGVGFNAFYQGASGYSFTADLSKDAMHNAAKNALGIAKASSKVAVIKAEYETLQPIKNVKLKQDMRERPWELETADRIDLINRMETTAKEYGQDISSLVLLYGEVSGKKYFTNSEGTEIYWEPNVLDLRTNVSSKTRSGDLVTGRDGNGGSVGIEIFKREGNTPEDFGKNAALRAKELLEAKAAPAGEFAALTENNLTGVLAHESFGHLTEGDFIVTKGSPVHDRIGETLGSEHVSMVDEGIMDVSSVVTPYYLPYDDEGVESKKVTLLDKGVLKGYLNSRATSSLSNGELTGNARALNYTFAPIPRMKNTYISPGDLTEEEALEQLGTGIYAIGTYGGQVSFDGTFMFKADRGYWIENGEKQYPLKDVTLTGNILHLLHKISGVTKDFELKSGYFGGCGKGAQYPLPVGYGGPKVLFDQVRFGGEMGA
ncbi:MAG: TldD/PmbA family protein [Candidatus Kariarchaeaceae archaeon]|jgi:TldD protein